MHEKFISDEFIIPFGIETDKFRMRRLMVSDAAKDYEAIMSSVESLRGTFGPNSNWPMENLTFKEDQQSIELHEQAFDKREFFTFTIMNLDESQCLGCVYIYPPDSLQHDAMVIVWTRKQIEAALNREIFDGVKKWIKREWFFKSVAYPGREITWEEYLNSH